MYLKEVVLMKTKATDENTCSHAIIRRGSTIALILLYQRF